MNSVMPALRDSFHTTRPHDEHDALCLWPLKQSDATCNGTPISPRCFLSACARCGLHVLCALHLAAPISVISRHRWTTLLELSLLCRLLRRCYLSHRTQLSLTVLLLLPGLGMQENTGGYPLLSSIPTFSHRLLWVKRRRVDPHQSALPRTPEEQQLTLQPKHV